MSATKRAEALAAIELLTSALRGECQLRPSDVRDARSVLSDYYQWLHDAQNARDRELRAA